MWGASNSSFYGMKVRTCPSVLLRSLLQTLPCLGPSVSVQCLPPWGDPHTHPAPSLNPSSRPVRSNHALLHSLHSLRSQYRSRCLAAVLGDQDRHRFLAATTQVRVPALHLSPSRDAMSHTRPFDPPLASTSPRFLIHRFSHTCLLPLNTSSAPLRLPTLFPPPDPRGE